MTAERALVIGLGQFGTEHLKSYLGLGHQICCAVDTSDARTRAVAEAFDVPVDTDGLRAIQRCRPSLVSIATGPDEHLPLVEAALSVGARVLVEKPFAASVDVAQSIAELPGANERVTPGHILRFDRSHRWVAQRISSGAIGSIVAVDSERHREHGHARRYADHTLASLTLYHDLDLAAWLDRSLPISVTASAVPSRRGAPTYLAVSVHTAGDTLWTLRCSWQLPEAAENLDRLQVFGTAGMIDLLTQGGSSIVTLRTESHSESRVFEATDALRDEIEAFVEGRGNSVVTVDDAVNCVRLVQTVEESALLTRSNIRDPHRRGTEHQEHDD